MNIQQVHFDCRHFRGDIPCKPNKERDKICENCDEYSPISKKILIIKLGALGDVIRTTPLVTRFREIYPACHISWITHSPEILPESAIDRIFKWDFKNVYILSHQQFDIAINLDKDYEACALLSEVKAVEKYGFLLKDHHIAPATPAAEHKLLTGFFDSLSKKNTKSYLEEIFEICHLNFNQEECLLDVDKNLSMKWEEIIRQKAQGKKVIGLNTGCGLRWPTRLWPQEYWIKLIEMLQQDGYFPMVLGGPDEDEMNRFYSGQTGCYYPGLYSLKEFIALTNQTHLVVTAVSMMMHIATALRKPMILFVNIFNPHEFELYGRGEIVQPTTGCDCFYGQSCSRERHCMRDILPETVFSAIKKYV
ncbi:MAG TPA: glycosyltransferase family 9 protein [Bacteroidia bacterium]|nr:glycosyltransferase family 9 protein [Sphingobacteriales bacterium]HPD65186.1 glycosyltransferase family 9 protein [Bacteroidia bacterium]HRS58565.1 glycosyltransferase family 9 protein [Bacteroidia bacterium]HRU68407.1 glycosyltransferase family 9 protein [Bacteroidia bacterium]